MSHACQNVASDLVGGAGSGSQLFDVRFNGRIDLGRGVVETEVAQQHGRRKDRGGRIGLVLACDIRCGIGSNMDGYSLEALMHPEAEYPTPPTTAPASSVMMSPNRLSVRITSKRDGFDTMKMVVASICR